MMEQVWILLSAGAIWLMVREAEKADRRADACRRIAANRGVMRQRMVRAARQNDCFTEMPQLSNGKER